MGIELQLTIRGEKEARIVCDSCNDRTHYFDAKLDLDLVMKSVGMIAVKDGARFKFLCKSCQTVRTRVVESGQNGSPAAFHDDFAVVIAMMRHRQIKEKLRPAAE